MISRMFRAVWRRELNAWFVGARKVRLGVFVRVSDKSRDLVRWETRMENLESDRRSYYFV